MSKTTCDGTGGERGDLPPVPTLQPDLFRPMCGAPNDWDTVRGIPVLTTPPIEQKPLQPKTHRASRDCREIKRGFVATMSYAAVNIATLVDRAASR